VSVHVSDFYVIHAIHAMSMSCLELFLFCGTCGNVGYVISENIVSYILKGKKDCISAWRDEVTAGRHDGSLDALLTMELPEDFVFSKHLRESISKMIPGIKNLLLRDQLVLEMAVSSDLSRPNSAESFAKLLETEFASYKKWYGDLVKRHGQGEEAIKQQKMKDHNALVKVAREYLEGVGRSCFWCL